MFCALIAVQLLRADKTNSIDRARGISRSKNGSRAHQNNKTINV